ncbi:MAG: RNA-directed DNA polymerase [Oscillospiraceae bacterium]
MDAGDGHETGAYARDAPVVLRVDSRTRWKANPQEDPRRAPQRPEGDEVRRGAGRRTVLPQHLRQAADLALARKIKDKRFLRTVYSIIESCGGGLAIGYYICQWLANFYLEPLDRYIMTLPGVKYMTRYMDNITLLGPNKKQLHKARKLIAAFMQAAARPVHESELADLSHGKAHGERGRLPLFPHSCHSAQAEFPALHPAMPPRQETA